MDNLLSIAGDWLLDYDPRTCALQALGPNPSLAGDSSDAYTWTLIFGTINPGAEEIITDLALPREDVSDVWEDINQSDIPGEPQAAGVLLLTRYLGVPSGQATPIPADWL